ncbi:MAG TPA: DUF1634 domain-containing protein [Edaphobacter sp.]|nr:DUF1634 domain-containing protein [Edaphobacter sp.]
MGHRPALSDERMEYIMGRLLQAGVLLASVVVLTGGILFVWSHFGKVADYRNFSGAPAELRSISGLLHLLRIGDATAIVQIGVLLLIATPIARVVFAVVGFALEQNKLYVVVSLTVLAVLMISLFGFA